jgi:hypothetical protein
MIGNCAEMFYARDGFWSFHTAKTLSGRKADRNPAVQRSSAARDVLSLFGQTARPGVDRGDCYWWRLPDGREPHV